MKNIWLMLKKDLKHIFTNEITFIFILILIVIPAILVTFVVQANKSPFDTEGNAVDVKVAIVNLDKGGTINNTWTNLGKEITNHLLQDKTVKWESVSFDEAIRGKVLGEYYGEIVIPSSFTKDAAAIDIKKDIYPKIAYSMNIQENIVTPTFTALKNLEFQIHIEESIVRTVNMVTQNIIGEVQSNVSINARDMQIFLEAILDLSKNKENYLEQIRKCRDQASKALFMINKLEDELSNSEVEKLDINLMEKHMQEFLKVSNSLKEDYYNITGKKLDMQIEELKQHMMDIKEIKDTIGEDLSYIQENIKQSKYVIAEIHRTAMVTDRVLTQLVRGLNGVDSKLGFLADGNGISRLIYILKNRPELVAEYLEVPVLMERVDNTAGVDEYTVTLPFYITIGMWLGKAILVSLLSVRQKVKLDNQSICNSYKLQQYFAKGIFFIVLGCIQDLLIVFSINILLGIRDRWEYLLLLMMILGSIAFTVMVYTVISTFKRLGKAIIYTVSVLQLFLLGGAFPLQVEPILFQGINKLLPFTYFTGSLREIGVGYITSNLVKSSVILGLFIIGYAILGGIGKIYLEPYIIKLSKAIRKSTLLD